MLVEGLILFVEQSDHFVSHTEQNLSVETLFVCERGLCVVSEGV